MRPPDSSRQITEVSTQVLHEKDQVQRVGRGSLEAEPEIEATGVVIGGVNDESPHAHLFGDRRTTQHRVLQERTPETTALMPSIDGKPSENQDRHGPIGRLALDGAGGGVGGIDLANCESVVADDPLLNGRYEHANRPARFRMSRVPEQPRREELVPAVEPVQPVLPTKRLRARVAHCCPYSKTLGFEKSSRSPAGIRGGRSSISLNACQLSSSNSNRVLSARTRLASATAACLTKSVKLEWAEIDAARTSSSSDSATRRFQR